MTLKSIFLVGFVIGTIAVEISEAQGNINGTDVNLVGIPITLYCTPDGGASVLGLATPPFRGANVKFQCGNNKTNIAKATTNNFGFSYIVTSAIPVLPFFPPDSNCKLVVDTALSTCDSSLPSTGSLQSGLKFAGTLATGGLKVANYAPTGFRYNATL